MHAIFYVTILKTLKKKFRNLCIYLWFIEDKVSIIVSWFSRFYLSKSTNKLVRLDVIKRKAGLGTKQKVYLMWLLEQISEIVFFNTETIRLLLYLDLPIKCSLPYHAEVMRGKTSWLTLKLVRLYIFTRIRCIIIKNLWCY